MLFMCELCPFKSSTKKGLEQHVGVKHNGESQLQAKKVLACQMCDWTSPDQAKLNRHTKSHAPKELQSQSCHICNKSLANMRNLKKHIEFHSKQKAKKTKCSQCFFTNQSKLLVQKHFKDLHRKKICYTCSKCDIKLKTKRELLTHERKSHPKIKTQSRLMS